MAHWKPAPVIGGAYSDDAKPWSCQDTLNYIPVMAERPGGRSPAMLRGVPGMSLFCEITSGGDESPILSKPIRGARNVEGLLLVVSGSALYKVSAAGAVTSIGTIPGVGRVSMSHNQIAGGNEVAIANGQSGYVYNTVTGTLAQITDEGFPGAISFDFIDGYITGIEPARRFAFHSNLAAATDYNTLDRYEAEGSPDKLVGQIVDHREWWLFSERTIEPFVNTGAATNTFQRASNTMIEVGCASGASIAQMDSSVFWVGNDGIVYRANGYTPQRISTHAIEQALAKCNIAQCFSFTFEDAGHKVYYITCPDGQTWGYDAASGEWHRRQSEGLNRWRINTLTKWNGLWIAGDYASGKLYKLNWKVQHENGGVLERRRITGVLHDNQNRVTVDGVALVFDTGGGIISGLPPMKLAGDLPNGVVGASGTLQYAVSNGVGLVTCTIASGTLPPGATMNASGQVTYDYTTAGQYSWTVQATDAIGQVAALPDSALVSDSINSAILADAPLLYWPLTETTGTTAVDLSGNGYTGTLAGSYTRSSSGLTLTANEAGVTYPGGASGSSLDVGTLTSWALEAVITRLGAGGISSENIAKQWRSPNFGTYIEGLHLLTTAYPSGGMAYGINVEITGPSAIPDNTRTHLMMVRDGGSLTVYVNGAAVSTRNDLGMAVNNSSDGAPFSVGGGTADAGMYPNSYGFIGTIEHVVVYDHAVTADRVLYHAQMLDMA